MGRGTTLYLRSLPEGLVREAKAVAARRGITLSALVTEALQKVVGPQAEKPAGMDRLTNRKTSDKSWRGASPEQAESMRWFERNRSRLLHRYRDQYVAIYRGRVIDHDHDFDALARRVFAKLGPRPVFMPKVTEGERVVRVPSPRLGEV